MLNNECYFELYEALVKNNKLFIFKILFFAIFLNGKFSQQFIYLNTLQCLDKFDVRSGFVWLIGWTISDAPEPHPLYQYVVITQYQSLTSEMPWKYDQSYDPSGFLKSKSPYFFDVVEMFVEDLQRVLMQSLDATYTCCRVG